MIALHPPDLDVVVTGQQRRPAAPLTTWMPPFDDATLDALTGNPSFEIDWFLAAVLMSTPAAERADTGSLPLAG
jgi:hypothetical protein